MYTPYSSSADAVWGISQFTVRFIEQPLINLKDKLFPPSQKTLDKRLASYGNLSMFGFDAALDIAKDALAKGANPDNAILPKLDADWNNIGTETLLERATRNGKAQKLVEALLAPAFNAAAPKELAAPANDDTAAKPAAAAPAKPAA